MQFSSDVLCVFHRFDDELSRQGRLREGGKGDRIDIALGEMTTFLRVFDQFR